ncbi:hypothetical protein EDD16DRAFT_1521243 [Pisolithus croceorrhizus]|nr:hypothetical protein EDD16DRAFT_1521243 [Pisolithus croceorrhizus]KAI6151396.1 hypothetical protein EDD17DRAFT_1513396 [Pisolithus thermaeus]
MLTAPFTSSSASLLNLPIPLYCFLHCLLLSISHGARAGFVLLTDLKLTSVSIQSNDGHYLVPFIQSFPLPYYSLLGGIIPMLIQKEFSLAGHDVTLTHTSSQKVNLEEALIIIPLPSQPYLHPSKSCNALGILLCTKYTFYH